MESTIWRRTQIMAVRNAGDERMQSDLAEAHPHIRRLGQVASCPQGGSLRRIREEGALLSYLRSGHRDEAQPHSVIAGAWALGSAQSSCPVRATASPPLEQTHAPSATTLFLIFRVQHQSRGRVGAFLPATQPCSGGPQYQPRTAATADVRPPPIRATGVIGSPFALPSRWQVPSLPNG